MSYPHHLEADSVEEAVSLAEALLSGDEYNIFRGQTQDWPMRSSFTRLGAERQAEAKSQFLEFGGFVERTPELEALHGDRFGVMAVAQHYGIPTVLVDFTTQPSVAGWFASHGNAPEAGRQSIVYLAHEEYIEQQYRDVMPQLHTLRIDVANLWRLQAQSGLFLHLPFEDVPELDAWLDEAFGTIRFPHRGPIGDIPESAIYPDRKSRLEVLFDGFLSEQRLRDVPAYFEALGAPVIRRAPGGESSDSAPAFLTGFGPPVHESWSEDRLRAWEHPAERFRRVDHLPRLRLEFDPSALIHGDSQELLREQARVIEHFMMTRGDLREGAVDFHVAIAGTGESLSHHIHHDSPLNRTVGEDLADCWDGMRRFPYSDAVVREALAYLATAWARVHAGGESLYDAIAALLGDHMVLELGLAVGGQHEVAPVAKKELSAAMRADLPDLLLPEFHSWIAKPESILYQVRDPRRLFDFDRFVALFGSRLVPGQFLIRQRDAILFSPTRLERLGNY